MSSTHAGFETWIRFGPEPAAGIGTAGSLWHTWDSEGGDSLTMGEAPIDRASVYGARGKRSGNYRRGGFLPGGGLPATPFCMDGSSLGMLRLMRMFFQKVTQTSGGGSIAELWSFSPLGTNPDSGSWFTGCVQVMPGVAGAARSYLGGVVDSLNFHWETGQPLTITPTWKFLNGATNVTVAGNGTPCTGGFLQPPSLTLTWQGQAIYPTTLDIDLANGLYDVTSSSQRGRRTHVLGNFTGEVNLGLWRDDNQGSYFENLFASETVGTLIMTGTATAQANGGTVTGGTAQSMVLTAYCRVKPYDWNSTDGELIDTVPLQIMSDTDMSLLIRSSATALG